MSVNRRKKKKNNRIRIVNHHIMQAKKKQDNDMFNRDIFSVYLLFFFLVCLPVRFDQINNQDVLNRVFSSTMTRKRHDREKKSRAIIEIRRFLAQLVNFDIRSIYIQIRSVLRDCYFQFYILYRMSGFLFLPIFDD